jgi:hypothetical protein
MAALLGLRCDVLLWRCSSCCCGTVMLQCNVTLRLAFLRCCRSNATLQQQCSDVGRCKNNATVLGVARTTQRRWALQQQRNVTVQRDVAFALLRHYGTAVQRDVAFALLRRYGAAVQRDVAFALLRRYGAAVQRDALLRVFFF